MTYSYARQHIPDHKPRDELTHLVHGNHSINIDLRSVLRLETRIGTIRLRLERQPLQHLQLYFGFGNSLVNALTIIRLDQLNKALGLLLELSLRDKLSKVDSPRQRLQAMHIACRRGSVVLLRFAAIFTSELRAHSGKDILNVALFQDAVDVDVVVMQDLGVLDRGEDGLFQRVGEERVFIGRLVPTNTGLQTFTFAKEVVEKTELGARDFYPAG